MTDTQTVLQDLLADAGSAMESIGSSARHATTGLPTELQNVLPDAFVPARDEFITPLRAVALVGLVIVLLAIALALVQRARRTRARRRRKAQPSPTA